MTHNVTLPLRGCLHTQLSEQGEGGGGAGRERAGQDGKGEEGVRIKATEK